VTMSRQLMATDIRLSTSQPSSLKPKPSVCCSRGRASRCPHAARGRDAAWLYKIEIDKQHRPAALLPPGNNYLDGQPAPQKPGSREVTRYHVAGPPST
jgi:hypothetical protein